MSLHVIFFRKVLILKFFNIKFPIEWAGYLGTLYDNFKNLQNKKKMRFHHWNLNFWKFSKLIILESSVAARLGNLYLNTLKRCVSWKNNMWVCMTWYPIFTLLWTVFYDFRKAIHNFFFKFWDEWHYAPHVCTIGRGKFFFIKIHLDG